MQIKQTHHLPLITLNNHYGIKMRQKRERKKLKRRKEACKTKLGNDPLENFAARRRRATMMSTCNGSVKGNEV